MDVAGPKLRTGPIAPGPAVVKWRPQRDAYGGVEIPARIWLTPAAHPEAPPCDADACLPVSGRWLSRLKPGDKIRLKDARGSKRSMTVSEAVDQNRWAECGRTAYIMRGTVLTANTDPLGSRNSCGSPVVILEKAAEALSALD
jgi:pyruvate kinase